MEQEGRSLFRHLRCLIYKTLFASITGANRLILVLCQSSHLEFSLLLFLISCALRKGTWRSCTLRGFEPVSRKRNGGKAARENYSETALNSSASELSGDWVFGRHEKGKYGGDKQLQFPNAELGSKPANEVWMQFEAKILAYLSSVYPDLFMMSWMKKKPFGVSLQLP